jgi:ATP synthase protein I
MSNSESSYPSNRENSVTAEINLPEVIDNSMGEFYQLRNNLLIGTIIVALVGSILAWWLFSWQTSLNYLLGTGFGLIYLNMLAKAVERVGEKKKGVGLTRLAMFVGLMIVAIKIQALELIPIFLGFITYKVTILFYVLPLNLLADRNKSEQKT